jgi:hypothetical protein
MVIKVCDICPRAFAPPGKKRQPPARSQPNHRAEDRDGESSDSAPQQVPIMLPIASESEQELPIMPAMRQMIEFPRHEVTIGP